MAFLYGAIAVLIGIWGMAGFISAFDYSGIEWGQAMVGLLAIGFAVVMYRSGVGSRRGNAARMPTENRYPRRSASEQELLNAAETRIVGPSDHNVRADAVSSKPSVIHPKAMQFADVPSLRGIAGWLMVLAIGQVLGLLTFLIRIAEYFQTWITNKDELEVLKKWPVTAFGESALNVGLLVFGAYTVVLFFVSHANSRPISFISGS